ncbi:hypothetical protein [Burkholderia sp. BE12]|nr:hypothetical protein [Burkholderia sp. BE12]
MRRESTTQLSTLDAAHDAAVVLDAARRSVRERSVVPVFYGF